MSRSLTRTTALAAVAAACALSSAGPARADTGFVAGSGTSSAGVVGVGIRSAGAAIGFGLGQVRTRFAGAQGNASAAEVDLGLFDTLAKAPLACGYSFDKAVPPGFVPAPAVVSSGDGAAQKRTASAGAGGPLQFGGQYAAAAPNASATATVDATSLDLPGVVEMLGGTASSTATLVPGSQRASAAQASMGGLSLAGDLVQLRGLGWTAAHRTGAQSDATAGFTVDSMTVAGKPMPTGDPGQLQTAITAANQALAGIGLSLNPPTLRTASTGISVGPLRLSISATPQLRAVLAAALIGIQPLRTQLLAAVAPLQASPDCGLARALGFGYLAADLATLALGDGGAVDLDLGGAAAGTDGTAYANPFDNGYGLIHPGAPLAPMLPSASGVVPASAASISPEPGEPVVGPAPVPAPPPGAPRQVALATASESCRSASGGGCAGRHGPLAGWLILALVVVLATADRLVRRIAR
ncbi:MAG TPA: hypothetical protein VHV82_20430 [Sporichthyaceae bacterium]|jgi:hypothetical protein|nr:hypothetical protein [Sporichthyaceae bacterium]